MRALLFRAASRSGSRRTREKNERQPPQRRFHKRTAARFIGRTSTGPLLFAVSPRNEAHPSKRRAASRRCLTKVDVSDNCVTCSSCLHRAALSSNSATVDLIDQALIKRRTYTADGDRRNACACAAPLATGRAPRRTRRPARRDRGAAARAGGTAALGSRSGGTSCARSPLAAAGTICKLFQKCS